MFFITLFSLYIFFFFSSRRRHTRYWRDWSSDVCSSDLRATTHRWLPAGDEPLRTYVIEANSHIAPPKRYLSRYGQLLEHAPYCERDLREIGRASCRERV